MRAGTSQVVGTKAVGTRLGAGNPWVQNRGVASCLQGSHAAVGTVEVSTALLAVEVAVRQGAEAEEVPGEVGVGVVLLEVEAGGTRLLLAAGSGLGNADLPQKIPGGLEAPMVLRVLPDILANPELVLVEHMRVLSEPCEKEFAASSGGYSVVRVG